MAAIKNLSKIAGMIAQGRLTEPRKKSPSSAKAPGASGAANKGSIVKQDDPIGTATVTCGALNVRDGAGTNYQRIGGLTQGKTVNVYEEKDGWIRIGYGTEYGWVLAQYTTYKPKTDTKPETQTPETEPPETEKPETEKPETSTSSSFQVRVTPSDGLNVRTGPGTGYDRIGGLTQGTVVTVIEEKDGWYKIEYEGSTGWICAEYTEKVGGSTTEPSTPSSGESSGGDSSSSGTKTVITTDALNLRDAPSTSGNWIVTMPAGTKLDVLEEKDGWYKVNYNGQTGWCCADYTMVYDPSAFAGSGKPAEAVKYAASFLGKTTKYLVGVIPYLQDLSIYGGTNNGFDNNCANFVSAILQNFGLLNSHQINVSGLASACLGFGYHTVSKSQAKPGDVWISSGHTELVESNSGGTVTMIGSNNGGDNIQEISRDSWSAQNVSAKIYSLQ